MPSRRLISALLLPPADPAGAKPRRDLRCLARVSRHEVPKTAGKRTPVKMYDPARVSHIPVRQSVRHPSGVVYIRHIAANPGSSALRASTTGLCRSDPYRGPLPGSLLGMAYTSVSGTSCLDRCLWNGHPSDAGVLCEPISLGRASDASDSSDPSDKIAQSAELHPARVLGV